MSRRGGAVLIGVAIVAAAGVGVFLLTRNGPGSSSAGVQTRSGDLYDLVRTLVDEMPRSGSNAYVDPTEEQRTQMSSAYRAIEAGNLDQAASIADPLDYEVVRYTDTTTGRSLVLLQERRRSDGSWPHASGTHAHAAAAT